MVPPPLLWLIKGYKRLGDRIEWVHGRIFCSQLSFEDTASEDSLQVVQNDARLALLKGVHQGVKRSWSPVWVLLSSHAPWHKAPSLFYSNSCKGLIWAASYPLWEDIWLLFGKVLIRESVPFIIWQIIFFISEVQVHGPRWGFCHLPLKEAWSQVS